jgi:hypothetical protein
VKSVATHFIFESILLNKSSFFWKNWMRESLQESLDEKLQASQRFRYTSNGTKSSEKCFQSHHVKKLSKGPLRLAHTISLQQ